MTAFVWTVTIINAVVALMALMNCAMHDEPKKRALAAGAVAFQGGIALWGFWVLLT